MALSIELVEELREIIREERGFEMPLQDAERAAAWLVAYADGLADAAHNPPRRGSQHAP